MKKAAVSDEWRVEEGGIPDFKFKRAEGSKQKAEGTRQKAVSKRQ